MNNFGMIAFVLSVFAMAYHSHAWVKQNEVRGRDAYGNAVVICSWSCYDGHQAQTQGFGFCPMPSP